MLGVNLLPRVREGKTPENDGDGSETTDTEESEVQVLKTSDREQGIRTLLENYDLAKYEGKSIALKANFNDAHPFPAATHIDTLRTIVESLKGAGVVELTMAERSGMGYTRSVLEEKGVYALAEELEFNVVALNEEGSDAWTKVDADGLHWRDGFYVSNVFLEADYVVQTCCLKTHRFGGHFTMSLKNSVGLVAKTVPDVRHNYMNELHGSLHQRRMIAEINKFYDIDFVVMDALKAFVNRGPESGDTVSPGLLLASRDRVALDAVGVAILRSYGTTTEVMRGPIFELDQIKRAAELGIGVDAPEKIKLVPLNDGALGPCEEIEVLLNSA
ncbi:MAG: DUF362 domain-containing protein [Candidatus Bathyarchaeota archaeon]|nr:MAG: DUF362 domain-containing protein [Candidatus Bathyarchaeota archaeon]